MYVNLLRGIQSIHPYSFQDIKNNILNEKQRCETTTARLSTNKLKDTTPKFIKIVDTNWPSKWGISLKMSMPSKQKARKRCAKKWLANHWQMSPWPNQLDRHPGLSQSFTCQHCHNQLENLVPGSSDRNYHQGHDNNPSRFYLAISLFLLTYTPLLSHVLLSLTIEWVEHPSSEKETLFPGDKAATSWDTMPKKKTYLNPFHLSLDTTHFRIVKPCESMALPP